VENKLKQLMKEEFKTSLSPIATSTLVIPIDVHVQQIQSQPGLVTRPTLANQHLGW
jgi:hypothetical protein